MTGTGLRPGDTSKRPLIAGEEGMEFWDALSPPVCTLRSAYFEGNEFRMSLLLGSSPTRSMGEDGPTPSALVTSTTLCFCFRGGVWSLKVMVLEEEMRPSLENFSTTFTRALAMRFAVVGVG